MKKHDETAVPFFPVGRDFYPFAHEVNNYDPLGSYTGNPSAHDNIPVQDADDL